MTCWHSLYLPYTGNVADPLADALAALGYERYAPFGLIPGKAYPESVKLFVAPARDGWTRIIGSPDPALLPVLSQLAPVLLIELDGAQADIRAYAAGTSAAVGSAFAAYASVDCLDRALDGGTQSGSGEVVGKVALDALPADVQSMAGQVDLQQAGKLFERMSATLARKTNADPAADDLLKLPDWSSAGGRRIRALMDCLGIPGWQSPDFVTLRDAYALHLRRQRSPQARLYPGDAEALAAVPDALTYTPIYGGKLNDVRS